MAMAPISSTNKATTGSRGLDDVLSGGFPRDRLFLVQGDPGVGKTTLALQFLLDGAQQGEAVLYITLSETKEELLGVAQSHGWSLEKIHLFELSPADSLAATEENTLFHPSEVELGELMKQLLETVARLQPTRVVFDSLSEIRLLAQSPLRYRREILMLKQFFAGRGCTVLLLDDKTSEPNDRQLQSLAHGVLSLEQLSPIYGPERRRLRVIKLRGVKFRGGYHDFSVVTGGIVVYPRLIAAEHRDSPLREPVSSGVPELDALTGGGFDRGTSSLLLGPAGSGKSNVASQYAVAAAAKGDKVVMFCFDETVATLRARTRGLAVPLETFMDSGMIEARQIDPAEMAPGQFVHEVRMAVEERGARIVVIDSLNGYLNAMPEEQFLILQLHELLTHLAQQGVLTILTMAQHGLVGSITTSIDVSYLADAVLLFRHFEIGGRLSKSISMLKKRTGAHEDTIRELHISSRGITLGPRLDHLRGVLTGLPELLRPSRATETDDSKRD